MNYKKYCLVSGALFTLVALAHLYRILNGLPATVGSNTIPMYASWIGLIVPACLAFWAFRIVRA